MTSREIEVIVQIAGKDVIAGRIWPHLSRQTESATFSYADEYLARNDAYPLDPALGLVAGQQQSPDRQPIFGAFGDCAPDGWGRKLIQRAESRRSREQRVTGRGFTEIDYLLGVRDDLRQGALRFRKPSGGPFLADEQSGVPTLIDLPDLLAAAERFERDEADDDDLSALLLGGSSLGGARPKAHVNDSTGPAIAKFPSPERDRWDVTRWERTALALAAKAGILVPRARLETIAQRPVLITDRFDRDGVGRIGYVSAMTMLEATDRQTRSYLEIADVIETQSPEATEELHQLWRRIAFSILISNTDDHLRNHGFLRRSTAGWSLSPAFDLNPDPSPGEKHLATAITLDDTEARIDTLLGVAEYFRLDDDAARATLGEVLGATSSWRSAAKACGLNGTAIDEMAPAFEHEQTEAAAHATA